jgi:hypothetical protein
VEKYERTLLYVFLSNKITKLKLLLLLILTLLLWDTSASERKMEKIRLLKPVSVDGMDGFAKVS